MTPRSFLRLAVFNILILMLGGWTQLLIFRTIGRVLAVQFELNKGASI
jgi:hypothetical protein